MAYYSVSKRKGKYCCQVRWRPDGSKNRKSSNRTFVKYVNAVEWGKKRVLEIENGHEGHAKDKITLGALIDKYLNDPHVKIGRSKEYSLSLVRDCEIATIPLPELKSMHIVDFCKDRNFAGAGMSTVACDVSHLRSVLRNAEALYDIGIDEAVIIKAMPTLHSLNLVGKSGVRTRRPKQDEIEALRDGLMDRQRMQGSSIPFVDMFDFSILSCMRVGEICEILWEDLNVDESWVWVRNRKDPRKKAGNHMKVPLLGGALDVALKQKKIPNDPRIFPHNPRSVSAGFQRVRNALGIKDLRYHDLRREGASRLFEAGYKIDEVAQVTGHRNLNTLWRIYTDLSPNRLTG